MNVLIIGQGGREHALAKALVESSSVDAVHVIPGSDGMAEKVLCHKMDWKDTEALLGFVERSEIELVIIGPEDPLVHGLADRLRDHGVLVFGPSGEGARLEGSKIFAKEFMRAAQVPTAGFAVVSSVEEVQKALKDFEAPYVLKADGLAAGKGVVICQTSDELLSHAEDFFVGHRFGRAGQRALLEEFQEGWELSFHILTDGQSYSALPLSQDHKRLKDGDEGPNTGGMGTVAPLGISQDLRTQIEEDVIAPVLKELSQRKVLYRGVLYIGLMVTKDGPRVIEFNCRFGDPETQVMFPLVEGDWGSILKAVASGETPEIKMRSLHTACVVLAAPGYPEATEKGVEISGNPLEQTSSSYFLHAGTARKGSGQWVTHGGRVLNAIGLGSTHQEALDNAYSLSEKVSWPGLQKRSDIGHRS